MSSVPEIFVHPACTYAYSIQEGDTFFEEANPHLYSASSINEWLHRSPYAKATMSLYDGDETIELPMYTLRRRNAIVAELPEAPLVN
jgi:hypothetical protein